MAMIRWGGGSDLVSQLERMQREMEGLMGVFGSRGFAAPSTYRPEVYPALNIYGNGEGYILRAEVPGIDPKSLEVEVKDDTITLRGERQPIELPEGASYHRRERDFGTFSRSMTLPDQVNADKVVATCKDGILEVHLPYAEQAKRRKISVKA